MSKTLAAEYTSAEFMQKVTREIKWSQLLSQLLNRNILFCLSIIALFIGSVNSFSQSAAFNHPELKWSTIETEHFSVHFHQGTKRTAELIAKIAEDVYVPITSLYNYMPDTKVHFIIKDYDDNSNGASYFYDNKIEIWAPPMDFHLRGTHNWLRDVVTHEFTHIISLGAARKFSRRIPAIYFQYLGYEKEKRKDVIHGYPNRIVSLPFAGTSVPMWFAEGVAQFQRLSLYNDWWDTFRDMVLRSAVLNQELLTPNEMDVFGSSSIRNERVYNQGLGMVIYIAKKYGEDKVAALARAMSSITRLDFSSAMHKVLGKTENQFYDEWTAWLKQSYLAGTAKIRNNIKRGKEIYTNGSGNFYPVFDPTGRRLAFLSNHGSGYFSHLDLMVYDIAVQKTYVASHDVDLPLSWSPDGKKIAFAKKHRVKHGSLVFDIFIFNLGTKKENAITNAMRARSPAWSPDRKSIACIIEQDGTSNIILLNQNGKNQVKLTNFSCGEKIYTPRFSANGRNIIFTFSKTGVGRDIASINISGGDFQYIIKTGWDERDAFPGKSGKYIYFSSDLTGIFNIYKYEIKTGKTIQLTNVTGGAFMPSANRDEELVYSRFGKHGYKIAMLKKAEALSDSNTSYKSPFWTEKQRPEIFANRSNGFDCIPDTAYLPASGYKMTYSKMSFFPRLVYDFPGEMKAGAYFTGSDILDKFSVMGGAAVNRLADIDLFSTFTYRKLTPTLFIELYHQVRHTSDLDAKFRFDLSEVDLGADWLTGEKSALRTFYTFSRYNSRMTYKDRGIEQKFPYTYHIGNKTGIKFVHNNISLSRYFRIAPNGGRKIQINVEHAWNRFLNGFEVNSHYGTIVEKYDKYSFNRYEIEWHEYLKSITKKHSIMIRIKAGVVDAPIDDFYNFFAGGLDGLKGYPFYSIEGRKLLQMGVAYRVVLGSDMKFKMGFLQLRDLALSTYGQMGNAWDEKTPDLKSMKRDIGVQLRISMNAFYSFPLCFFVDVSYGLDKFINKKQQYGNEFRSYVGMLFDFPD